VFLQELRAMVRENTTPLASTGEQILDHLVWRAVFLGGLLFLAVVAGLVLRHRLRSKAPSA
jgi:hypothetical protein